MLTVAVMVATAFSADKGALQASRYEPDERPRNHTGSAAVSHPSGHWRALGHADSVGPGIGDTLRDESGDSVLERFPLRRDDS